MVLCLLMLVASKLMWLRGLLHDQLMSSVEGQVVTLNELVMDLLQEILIIMIYCLPQSTCEQRVWRPLLDFEPRIPYRWWRILFYLYICQSRLHDLLF